eukprot:2700546-Rhodomonas_salina.1
MSQGQFDHPMIPDGTRNDVAEWSSCILWHFRVLKCTFCLLQSALGAFFRSDSRTLEVVQVGQDRQQVAAVGAKPVPSGPGINGESTQIVP